ncbi:MAG: hypothetical protein AB1345_07370, partial [Chloroflexota bacterium]
VFPALNWRQGKVIDARQGNNPDMDAFEVITVAFDSDEQRQFAADLAEHKLNEPPQIPKDDPLLNPDVISESYRKQLVNQLEEGLESQPEFVRIAGRWFPRALLVEVNEGHLNLAEAVLDMAGGGPLPTSDLLKEVELPEGLNPKLLEFSLDLALQEDPRFDEVGPAGKVLWFLKKLEPEGVQETPIYLQYIPTDYDRSVLTREMLDLEKKLEDELSPLPEEGTRSASVSVTLIYPHWRAGTLPLSNQLRHLFPTAYEAPRIRFVLVDGDTGRKFPGWVVRNKHYVYGLGEWYAEKKLIPGSLVRVQIGKYPGEVVISAEGRRSGREWLRTVLLGKDGGIVYGMLKHLVSATYDERMAIVISDVEMLDEIWNKQTQKSVPFERVIVDTLREIAKLNPQGHVHASELYAAVNTVRRCPPGPIMSLLASRPWFVHVGDLHFRLEDKVEV